MHGADRAHLGLLLGDQRRDRVEGDVRGQDEERAPDQPFGLAFDRLDSPIVERQPDPDGRPQRSGLNGAARTVSRRLRAMKPEQLVPGRGSAMLNAADCEKAIAYTQRWVTDLFSTAKAGVAANKSLKEVFTDTRKVMDPTFGGVFIYEHCLPFDVSRAFDEAQGIKNPRIWTAQRDIEMWKELQDS